MNSSLAKVKTTLQAITLLERFGRLKIDKLEVEERFTSFFFQFGKDLEDIKNVRMNCCSSFGFIASKSAEQVSNV